jgi:hypothetical protein
MLFEFLLLFILLEEFIFEEFSSDLKGVINFFLSFELTFFFIKSL